MARILVLDDDGDVLRLVQMRLEHEGHAVLPFSSPQKALELVLTGDLPDLVVLDVAMPEINGLEVLRTLRLGFGLEDLPAIFLSALVSQEDIDAGRALGATYLTKPFVASALVKTIDKALHARQ
ncbi:MAG TPA: response regulator [Candidatus Eisenbacteria bacterium]